MKVKSNEEIENALRVVVEEQGVRLAEIEFKQGKNPSLTVFIDKDDGITLDDCENVHNAIDPVLDELDPTYGEPYTLNVSSLGLDRPFKREDFAKNLGKKVEVWLKKSVGGKKEYDGELSYYDGEIIRLKISDDKMLTFDIKKQVEKVNKYIDF